MTKSREIELKAAIEAVREELNQNPGELIELQRSLADALNEYAKYLSDAERYDEVCKAFEEEVVLRKSLLTRYLESRRDYVGALRDLSLVYTRLGKFNKVHEALSGNLFLLLESSQNGEENVNEIKNEVFSLYSIALLRMNAEKNFRYENVKIEDIEVSPVTALASVEQAEIYYNNGEYDKAEKEAYYAHYIYTELLKSDFDKYWSSAQDTLQLFDAIKYLPILKEILNDALKEKKEK